ncbi:helix-turn-helix domain-containing protein [Nocardia brasiliensis]|uniref:MmyB family transcriptional regulator n=1 Tax=Nocardia brasiliensis TaxID=37326 RepID=UPI0024568536|nr:helix-turn-helix domain-containing protein [Nocardia brasiliensis]
MEGNGIGRRSNGAGRDRSGVIIPTLSVTMRQIREHKGLTRVSAYECHRITQNYLADLERGKYKPSSALLERLIAGYRLDADQARHLRELRARAVELIPEEELHRRVYAEPAFGAHLQDLQERGIPAAYLSRVFNVIECNDLLRAVLPGLDEVGSILLWMFTPDARDIVVDWEPEAVRTVATVKGVLGRHRETEQAADVVRKLQRSKACGEIWTSNIDISYGRDSTDLKLFRDQAGRIVSYSITMSEVPETSGLMLLTAIRKQGVPDTPPFGASAAGVAG